MTSIKPIFEDDDEPQPKHSLLRDRFKKNERPKPRIEDDYDEEPYDEPQPKRSSLKSNPRPHIDPKIAEAKYSIQRSGDRPSASQNFDDDIITDDKPSKTYTDSDIITDDKPRRERPRSESNARPYIDPKIAEAKYSIQRAKPDNEDDDDIISDDVISEVKVTRINANTRAEKIRKLREQGIYPKPEIKISSQCGDGGKIDASARAKQIRERLKLSDNEPIN